ncbi:MAG TPA: radical SAM protein [bacterium]|nr:radical SAM protein [bacterium]
MTLLRTAWHGFISRHYPVRPFGAVFMVTHRCNARCAMCNLWKDAEPDTPIDTFVRLVEQPLFKDIVNVAVTGGELTLRRDLSPLFQAMAAHCPRLDSVNLSSNAFLPERLTGIVSDLVSIRDAAAGTFKIIVQISLDGPGDVHDTIRGVPGGFDNVQESIRRLRDRFGALSPGGALSDSGVEIHYLCVLQPGNIDRLDDIRAMFDASDIPVTFNMICDASYLEVDPSTHPVLTGPMKNRLLSFFRNLLNSPSVDPRHAYHYREFIQWLEDGVRRHPCGMLSQHILVNHRGQILPCMNPGHLKYPDLNAPEDVNGLWSGRERSRVNRALKNTVCPGCTAACGPNTFDAILALIRQKLHG